MDSAGAPAPSYVTLVYTEGDTTFNIEVDVKDYAEEADQVLQLFVKAVLSDYSELVPSVSAEFEIEILAAVEAFVFVPPPPTPAP